MELGRGEEDGTADADGRGEDVGLDVPSGSAVEPDSRALLEELPLDPSPFGAGLTDGAGVDTILGLSSADLAYKFSPRKSRTSSSYDDR